MRIITVIFILLILLFGISFAVINASTVSFHYYFGTADLPLSMLLVLTFALGVFIGLGAMLIVYWRSKYEQHRLRKHIQQLQSQSPPLR